MAIILNIETATNICSVALARDGNIISLKENSEGQSHARALTTLITESLREANTKLSDLEAVSISKGPGSFTGLRIGVASAKGLCYALQIPLIGVNTLQSMASSLLDRIPDYRNHILCPMIDARRMEVYTAVFEPGIRFLRMTSATIIDRDSFDDLLTENRVVFFGGGMKKTIQHIGHQNNAIFFEGFEPSASGMVPFSEKSYIESEFESTAYFEPFYLKDFYTPQQPL